MSGRVELIILNLIKTRDSSAVIHTLSREYGRRSFLISISRHGSMATFLPLSLIEATIVENRKSNLWRARNFTIVHPLFGIRDNVYKNTITLFMSEVLFRTISDGVAEAGLFEWCRKSILTLDALERDYANFHLRFLTELAAAMGFAPTTQDLMPFAQNHLPSIRRLCECDFGEAMLLPLNGESRNEIADILLKYISYHAESAINVKSLRVLRELFS